MHDRHTNRQRYFNEQVTTTSKYVIPFLQDVMTIDKNIRVLEIGCGEGGNLMPFVDLGCVSVGVDLSEKKIENAKAYFEDHPNKELTSFTCKDIYDWEPTDEEKFDLIITRDVVEHIHDQDAFMELVKNKFLKPKGKFFAGFPPWQNPFGGHQQMCKSKVLSKLPYFHILPKGIYNFILKSFGETEIKRTNLLEIKQTRISLDRFERILKKKGYQKDKKIHWFINPNYQVKFGLKPRKQLKLISAIPYFRNYFITCGYYVVSPKEVVQ